jgi:hypothetical protein
VRIEIAEEQHRLEEDKASDPDRGRSAKRGQQPLGRHGLDGKEQKGT